MIIFGRYYHLKLVLPHQLTLQLNISTDIQFGAQPSSGKGPFKITLVVSGLLVSDQFYA